MIITIHNFYYCLPVPISIVVIIFYAMVIDKAFKYTILSFDLMWAESAVIDDGEVA